MKDNADLFYIQQIKAGNTQAFAPIVHKYQSIVLTIIIKIVENREDAEDIAQEVFIKVFKSLGQFKEEAAFSTWLYRIAYNTTLSELRKRKFTFVSVDDGLLAVDEPMQNEDEEQNLKEQLQYLDKALKKLAPDEAFLIALYYMDKQSVENISQISNLSVSNVKVKLHRIRKKLVTLINTFAQDEDK